MRLTYTLELDLSDDVLGRGPLKELTTPEEVSAEIMRQAFERVGKRLAGREIRHLSVFAHLDSKPAAVPEGVEIGDGDLYPGEECPTCGIAQLSKGAPAP